MSNKITPVIELVDCVHYYKDSYLKSVITWEGGVTTLTGISKIIPDINGRLLRRYASSYLLNNAENVTPLITELFKGVSMDRLEVIWRGMVLSRKEALYTLCSKPIFQFALYNNRRHDLEDTVILYILLSAVIVSRPDLDTNILNDLRMRVKRCIYNAFTTLNAKAESLQPIRLCYNHVDTEQQYSFRVAVDKEIYFRYLEAGYTEEALLKDINTESPEYYYTYNAS